MWLYTDVTTYLDMHQAALIRCRAPKPLLRRGFLVLGACLAGQVSSRQRQRAGAAPKHACMSQIISKFRREKLK